MFKSVFSYKFFYFQVIFYILLCMWWVFIQVYGFRETEQNYAFGLAYAFIALFGSINGLRIAKSWGGFQSHVGRGIMYLSLGLFGEFFGQLVWSYYNIIATVQVPYPSLADIGFFSIIPLYSLGMLAFAHASGARFTLKTVYGKLFAFVIPFIMLSVSYFLFLRNIAYDGGALKAFFDFGYPLGEAIFVSVALVTFSLSNSILGGQMRKRIMYLVFALVFQYATEYIFIYKAGDGSYYNAGIVDLMYATSFLIMSIGLLSFRHSDD